MVLTRLDGLSDEVIVVPILVGTAYAAFVFLGYKTGLVLKIPSLFEPRAGIVAVVSSMFGLGLVLAGAKHADSDPAAWFYGVAGLFMIALGAFIWFRRSN